MDEDVMKAVFLVFSLTVTGILGYGGITVISYLRKRMHAPSAATLAANELDAIHARLAAAESLEDRVAELEERLDFTERMLAQRDPEQLPAGPSGDRR